MADGARYGGGTVRSSLLPYPSFCEDPPMQVPPVSMPTVDAEGKLDVMSKLLQESCHK